jgi:hypothetical protein
MTKPVFWALLLLFPLGCNPAAKKPAADKATEDADRATQHRGEKPRPGPHQESLEKAVRAFLKGMASERKEDHRKALQQLEYTEKDVKTLFPRNNPLQVGLGIARAGFMDQAEPLAADLKKRGILKNLEVINLRTDPRIPGYDRAVAVLAPEVPNYGAILQYQAGKVGFHPLVFTDGRWVWLLGLDKLAALIK